MATQPDSTEPDYVEKLHTLPGHMHSAMRLYIERGYRPGSFLSAVLCNDLMEAIGRADDANVRALNAYAIYLYNYAPSACYGSPDKYDAWVQAGGLVGRESAAA